MKTPSWRVAAAATVLAVVVLAPAFGQSFSVDIGTSGVLTSGGAPTGADDILVPSMSPGSPPAPPPISIPGAVAVVPPPPPIEVDAFSFGSLKPLQASHAFFSVGRGGGAGVAGSAVAAQAAVGTGPESSSDIFSSTLGGTNTLVADGNGLNPVPTITLGLREIPAPPMYPSAPVSDVDGLDMRPSPGPGIGIFWSVDLSTIVAPGSVYAGTAPSDIWFSPQVPGYSVFPAVYTPGSGLGLVAGDDVDALVVVDDGAAGFSFLTDTIYYSLTPGSPTLTTLGASAADILVVGGGTATPSVLATAASLGLLTSDNLNALDFLPIPEPTSLALACLGLMALVGARVRLRR